MVCRFCGAELKNGGRFCVNCGAPVDTVNAMPGQNGPVQQGMPQYNNVPPGNAVYPAPNRGGFGNTPKKKKSPVPFIIIGAAVLAVIIGIIVVSAIIREKRMADSYYNFHTKEEVYQMMQEYENEEKPGKKSIGETMGEGVIDSSNGEGAEDDEEFQEKLKNSSSPWFKDPGDE